MENITEPRDSFEVMVTAYREATTPEERRMYLRGALRRLETDAEVQAERLKLLVAASAAEGK